MDSSKDKSNFRKEFERYIETAEKDDHKDDLWGVEELLEKNMSRYASLCCSCSGGRFYLL